MAFGETQAAALRVTGRDHVTAAWLGTTLTSLEYAYNLASFVDLYDQGHGLDLEAMLRLLRDSDRTSVESLNVAVRAFVFEGAQLEIDLVRAGNSFTIRFGGLAKVLQVIVSVFDPLGRADRHEKLRHEKVMNRLAEESKLTKVTSERLLLFPVLADEGSNFNMRAQEALGLEWHKELTARLVREFDRAVNDLGNDDIKAIEPSSLE